MGKLLRFLMALTSFVLVYYLINKDTPMFLSNNNIAPEQIEEKVKEAIEKISPEITVHASLIGSRIPVMNTQILTNGTLVSDVITEVFISKLGDFTLSVNMRSIRKVASSSEEESYEIIDNHEVFVDNNWIVFEKGEGKPLSYMAKVNALNGKVTNTPMLLELVCDRNEPTVHAVKVIEVEEGLGGLKFKNKEYKYIQTIYKASRID